MMYRVCRAELPQDVTSGDVIHYLHFGDGHSVGEAFARRGAR